MSQQIFPNVEEVLTILTAELPNGVYATDRADDPNPANRSYSSSELRAMAETLAELYANLADIDDNKSITTIQPDGLANWEKELFATAQDSSLPFATRQQNLLAKRRAFGGISLPAIQSAISGILTPLGLSFEILPYSGQYNGTMYGTWLLGLSQLGFDTYLGTLDMLIGAGTGPGITALDCSLNYAAAGITSQQLALIQSQAYTYEVRIYGNASATTLALLNTLLTQIEPARSTHIITNNASDPTYPPTYNLATYVSMLFS